METILDKILSQKMNEGYILKNEMKKEAGIFGSLKNVAKGVRRWTKAPYTKFNPQRASTYEFANSIKMNKYKQRLLRKKNRLDAQKTRKLSQQFYLDPAKVDKYQKTQMKKKILGPYYKPKNTTTTPKNNIPTPPKNPTATPPPNAQAGNTNVGHSAIQSALNTIKKRPAVSASALLTAGTLAGQAYGSYKERQIQKEMQKYQNPTGRRILIV